jgi:hypothetical protein
MNPNREELLFQLVLENRQRSGRRVNLKFSERDCA